MPPCWRHHYDFPSEWASCSALLSGWGGGVSGLSMVDGVLPDHVKNPTSKRPGTIENGRRNKLVVSVRSLAGDKASVVVSLNGEPYLPRWEGDPTSLQLAGDWTLRHSNRPGLGVFQDRIVFHSVRLRMITGAAVADSTLINASTNSTTNATGETMITTPGTLSKTPKRVWLSDLPARNVKVGFGGFGQNGQAGFEPGMFVNARLQLRAWPGHAR